MKKLFKILVLFVLIAANTGCIMVEVKGAGVFKRPIKYDNRYIAHIALPGQTAEEKNNKSGFRFAYLGNCGGSISFVGIMLPIIPVPWYFSNSCQEDGFYIGGFNSSNDLLGVTLQLRYNNITYDPYIDNGSVKLKITDFKAFKKAPDKTLIIHKKKPDGTIFTKELPFDWKIVTEVSGGL